MKQIIKNYSNYYYEDGKVYNLKGHLIKRQKGCIGKTDYYKLTGDDGVRIAVSVDDIELLDSKQFESRRETYEAEREIKFLQKEIEKCQDQLFRLNSISCAYDDMLEELPEDNVEEHDILVNESIENLQLHMKYTVMISAYEKRINTLKERLEK